MTKTRGLSQCLVRKPHGIVADTLAQTRLFRAAALGHGPSAVVTMSYMVVFHMASGTSQGSLVQQFWTANLSIAVVRKGGLPDPTFHLQSAASKCIVKS